MVENVEKHENYERRNFVNIYLFTRRLNIAKPRRREGRNDEWILLLDRRQGGSSVTVLRSISNYCFDSHIVIVYEIKRNIIVHFLILLSPRLSYKRWCAFIKEIESERKEIILVNHGIYCNSCTHTHYYYTYINFYKYSAMSSAYGKRVSSLICYMQSITLKIEITHALIYGCTCNIRA